MLSAASLDGCSVASTPLVSGERDDTASAKPAASVASTKSFIAINS